MTCLLLGLGVGLCVVAMVVLRQIFLGLAVYDNARPHGNPHPGM